MKTCKNQRQTIFGLMNRGWWIVCGLLAFMTGPVSAQPDEGATDSVMVEQPKPVKNTFESIWCIDAQTVMVPIKGTFEADFQHRFGTMQNQYDDFYGIFAASNIRLGAEYVPVDRLLVGFGITKFNSLWDFYGKYAILRQMKNGGSPVSMSYYLNMAIDTRDEEKAGFEEGSDRFSYFHSLMVARKITDKFSLQLSGNYSWFNHKEVYDDNGEFIGLDQNGHFSASALARYKLSNTIGVIAAYDLPLTSDDELLDPDPNLSFGLELTTSSHAFQLFVGNFQSLVPQYNHTYNTNSWSGNPDSVREGILIGFNITRLWNF